MPDVQDCPLDEADQEIVGVSLQLLGNFWNVTGILTDVELVTVTVTGI
jgi:hypothetical protein